MPNMEPDRYRRHLVTMAGALCGVAYVSAIFSLFNVWGVLL